MIDVIIRREKSVNNALLALFPAWPGYESVLGNLAMGHRQDLQTHSSDPRHFMRLTRKTDLEATAVWEFFLRLWDRYGALRLVEKATSQHETERTRRAENSIFSPLEEPSVEILVAKGSPIRAVSVTPIGRIIYTTDAHTCAGPGQWCIRRFMDANHRGLAKNPTGYGHLFWSADQYAYMQFSEYPLKPDGGAGTIPGTDAGIVAGVIAADHLVFAMGGLGLCTMPHGGSKLQWHKREIFRGIRGLITVSFDRVVAYDDRQRLFYFRVVRSRSGCSLRVADEPLVVSRKKILFVCSATPAEGWADGEPYSPYGPPAVLVALADGTVAQTNPRQEHHYHEIVLGERLTSLASSDDRLWAACGTESGRIVLLRNTCMFNNRSLTTRGAILGHIGPVTGLCFSGEHLLSAGEDGTLRRWRWRNFVTPAPPLSTVQSPARDHHLPGKRALILD